MHPCLGTCLAIGRTVVYHGKAIVIGTRIAV